MAQPLFLTNAGAYPNTSDSTLPYSTSSSSSSPSPTTRASSHDQALHRMEDYLTLSTLPTIYTSQFPYLLLTNDMITLRCTSSFMLDPPSSRLPPPIPPTTTPYQSQSPGPTRSGSDDRVSSHVSVTSPVAPTPPSRAHQSPHVAPVVTTPKYLPSAIAPTMPSFAASSEMEHNNNGSNRDDHVIVIPDNTSTHSHRLSIDFSVSGPTSAILGHGSARSRVHIEDDALQRPLATLSVSKRDGRSRWCEICKIVKPDRCHHCSECNMCVLRMDHHCPWVNGCVGFGNYKQFYLFILYGSLSAVWCVGSMIPLLVKALGSQAQEPNWNNGNWAEDAPGYYAWTKDESSSSMELVRAFDIQWVVITVIAFLLALLIVSFTVVHTGYILGNQTTIESLQNQRNMHVKVQYRKREQQPPSQTLGRDA
ncbi:hypothetical protein CPC16_003743, partial [Podila verticillata]